MPARIPPLDDLRLIGPTSADGRAPDRRHGADPSQRPRGGAARAIYAARPLEGLGIMPEQNVLRLSLAHYTTEAEVGRLTAALGPVL